MPGHQNRLRGGRGTYTGEQAYQLSGESYEQRAALNPLNDGHAFSAANSSFFSAYSDGIALAIDNFVLAPVGYVDRNYTLDNAHLRVITAQASHQCIAGIYFVSVTSNGHKQLNLVPGSGVSISTASTGVITQSLSNQIHLRPGPFYFVGGSVSTNAAVVNCWRFVDHPCLGFIRKTGVDELPKTARLDTFESALASVACPAIEYTSKLGKELFRL